MANEIKPMFFFVNPDGKRNETIFFLAYSDRKRNIFVLFSWGSSDGKRNKTKAFLFIQMANAIKPLLSVWQTQ